jgi:RimJ/RimL family protein N-acetyltransferase
VQLNFPDPPLSAAGIVLRKPLAGDVPWITAVCGDRELSRYVPAIPYPYAEADASAFVRRAASAWADGTSAAFVIADQADGTALGMIQVHCGPADFGLGEVGYWLDPAARGRGVATSAVRLVARWAFDRLGIERLSLETAPENAASQRVAGRAGFTREGLLRAWMPTKTGRRDCVMFSLRPGDLDAPAS